ncbi:unnamed protein product [Lactuca virosa]|uniref:AB hydrolase-1 domain-containing protein n=1 Tax=Lactuca virosa TaxID=75947 RepID=A0AAU9NQC9_9ASTR|nr:unnamed protein product [Lactuca virosa]
MEKISHNFIPVNALNLHVAEICSKSSPTVVFLHGFPGTWYSWRHQMVDVSNAGFIAIAPDLRGYGLSDPPPQPEKASFTDFLKNIASILDSLAISKAFMIGKDFGAMVDYTFALMYPEKVGGIVTLVLPFMPPGAINHHLPLSEGFYARRWMEPGRAEADFSRFDAKTVVKNLYIMFSKNEILIANEDQEIMDLVKPLTPLPFWFTEEDLATYGVLYKKSGFQTALQVPYRSAGDNNGSHENDPLVEAPSMLIIGEEDCVIKYPGLDEYIRSGEVKKYVPNLETIHVPHGSHFVNEQFPDKVNQLIITFLDQNKHRLVA